MPKVVINKCFGGFSLSREAVARLAELQGRACYFFTTERRFQDTKYVPSDSHGGRRDPLWYAFDIPNPNEMFEPSKNWHDMTPQEKSDHNALYHKHSLTSRPENRADPLLVQVVQELGEKANGGCADLQIVEIPDGVQWEVEEYDGNEHIAEVHRTWG